MQNKESQKKSNELLLCPFCGGEAKIDCYLYFDDFDDWFIRCTSCFCRTRTFKTKKSAIITWNNRKPMERIVERLKNELLESINKANDEMIDNGHTLDFEHYFGEKESYEQAIAIVKEEGGMND